MTTEEERNLLNIEIEKLGDLILAFETHYRYFKNVLIRMKKKTDALEVEAELGILSGTTLSTILDIWSSNVEALSLCAGDIEKILICEKSITEILVSDRDFLMSTYKMLDDLLKDDV